MPDERLKGDPVGRRFWRDRAAKLSEVYAVGRLFDLLLSDIGFEQESCDHTLSEINKQERIALQRAHGRIEPRKRFKGHSSHPLLAARSINNLYVDEGGKSNREPIDVPAFFSLGAVAIDDEECVQYCERADAIEQEFFGTVNYTFHEPDMRKHKGWYFFEGDLDRQQEFDSRIDRLIQDTDFKVFGVGIRKAAFREWLEDAMPDHYLPSDIYAVVIVLMIERYVDYIANTRADRIGRVTLESQGPLEDAYHQFEFARILLSGSQWLHPASFRNWLETGLRFVPKRGFEPTELADMVARSLYKWIRGVDSGRL